ncbi:hypothetical protein HXX76_010374 [Chlamydomonas incerta]|uniref:tRNA (guanine(9)-N(1))-methyltransferase n=1 Tax=Chlamydomonas incerta TaxID=51695 RepID=A0A835SXX3_CHLIN|nr:hypothetical protein HXX76_010374 [Chlamydomonas incerta]|eukprot:KAG2430279.1 hypothetical protein HXX76_010374 [Chlamydomonas incerta]
MADTEATNTVAGDVEAAEEAELAELEAQLYGGDEGGSDDPGSGAGVQEVGAAGPPMTKSQMKKKARLGRMLAKRQEQRQREKAAKATKRAEAKERKAAEFATMTDEQKKTMREEKQAKLNAHKEAEKALKERLKASLESGPKVVIDLDWEDKMTENDIRHLVQQLSFSYSANKQVEKPVHMMLTSFKGAVADTANKMISGMENWSITRTPQHYSELLGGTEESRGQLVYLTADSNTELEELDPAKTYIIGGIVDHNRYKGLCEGSARAAGIATARLPIAKHIQLASRAVLTVNHVFQILVEWYARRDWAAVLDAVLPMRKRAEYAQQVKDEQQRKDKAGDKGTGRGAHSKDKGGAASGEQPAANAAAEEGAAGTTTESAGAAEAGAENGGAAAGGAADAVPVAAEAGEDGKNEGEEARGLKRKAEAEPALTEG